MPKLDRHAATPALAPSADAISPDPAGAELIGLGEQFEALLMQWLPLHAEQTVRGWKAHEKAWKLAMVLDPDDSSPEETERFLHHLKRCSDETGHTEFDALAEAVAQAMDPVAKRIMETPATCPGGIRAKALVALYANHHLWDEDHDDSYPDRTVRALVEACAPIQESLALWRSSLAAATAAAEAQAPAFGRALH